MVNLKVQRQKRKVALISSRSMQSLNEHLRWKEDFLCSLSERVARQTENQGKKEEQNILTDVSGRLYSSMPTIVETDLSQAKAATDSNDGDELVGDEIKYGDPTDEVTSGASVANGLRTQPDQKETCYLEKLRFLKLLEESHASRPIRDNRGFFVTRGELMDVGDGAYKDPVDMLDRQGWREGEVVGGLKVSIRFRSSRETFIYFFHKVDKEIHDRDSEGSIADPDEFDDDIPF